MTSAIAPDTNALREHWHSLNAVTGARGMAESAATVEAAAVFKTCHHHTTTTTTNQTSNQASSPSKHCPPPPHTLQITNAPRGGTGKELAELHEAVRALVKSMNTRCVTYGQQGNTGRER